MPPNPLSHWEGARERENRHFLKMRCWLFVNFFQLVRKLFLFTYHFKDIYDENFKFKKLFPCAAIISALFVSPVSLANETESETMTQAEALAIDAKHYAAAYGVDETEAMRRLLIMHGSTEEIEALEKTYQDRLAGVYFDNGANFGLNFVLTGDETPQERKLIRKAQKAERKAEKQAAKEEKKAAKQQAKDEKKQQKADQKMQKHYAKWGITEVDVNKAISMIEQPTEAKVKFRAKAKDKREKQVEKLGKNLDKLNKQIGNLVGTYFDVRDEKFVIQINEKDNAKFGLTAEKVNQIATTILNEPVKVENVPAYFTNQSIKGGTSLQGNLGICTSGFVVKDRTTGQIGIVTAGHCSKHSTFTYTDRDGTIVQMKLVRSEESEKSDMAFYVPVTTTKASPSFYPDSGNKPRNLVGWKSVSATNEKGFLTTGSFLCMYGQTTGVQSCGEVVDKNFAPRTFNANGQEVGCGKAGQPFIACGKNFVLIQPKEKSGQAGLKCAAGDSGGPWFAYGNAYGIYKGGVPIDENGYCSHAVYTPIIRINDLDLTLYYGK
ncbi:S1 family peptidase [Alysiella filiformis]|nr:S1 family peptidase [Alysiella filiformis]QMT31491.1 hypothetical protein H3L97_00825 [Alysiella filiformis]UBQ55497.1 S1 family peptidase [Alysiella filiformis DSM 16848]